MQAHPAGSSKAFSIGTLVESAEIVQFLVGGKHKMPAQLLTRWFDEVWNQDRRETVEELLDPACVIYDGGQVINGPTAFRAFIEQMRGSFSDIRVTCHESITEGDATCLRWTAELRHTGEFMGMPATGKRVTFTGISMVRVANGKFVSGHQNWDMFGLMMQLRPPAQ
jgi:predicted ester cyclase